MDILYLRKQNGDPWWKEYPKRIRDWYKFHHREGFFRASLHSTCSVNNTSAKKFIRMTHDEVTDYDVILVHHMCNYNGQVGKFESLERFLGEVTDKIDIIPLALLDTTATSTSVPSDRILDKFDLVFEREPYKDKSRYSTSPENQSKISATVLSCPLVKANLLNFRNINTDAVGKTNFPDEFNHDIFFAGANSVEGFDNVRCNVVKELVDSELEFHGGLQADSEGLDEKYQFPTLSEPEFHETIWTSKVNLALSGCGEFTYRHWELWALHAFMMTDVKLNQLEFPFEVEENVHYVWFDDVDDLIEKINYYLDHPEERQQIARKGRELFEREYDFQKHGRYLTSQIETVVE